MENAIYFYDGVAPAQHNDRLIKYSNNYDLGSPQFGMRLPNGAVESFTDIDFEERPQSRGNRAAQAGWRSAVMRSEVQWNIQHTVQYTASNPARFERLWR